jgi:hypothetical protein
VLGADIVLVDDSVELLILSILSPESKRAMHSEADTSHALWPPCGPAQREVPKDSSEIGASTARRCDGRACASPRAARKASGCCAAVASPRSSAICALISASRAAQSALSAAAVGSCSRKRLNRAAASFSLTLSDMILVIVA